jgi:hypothetical protein
MQKSTLARLLFALLLLLATFGGPVASAQTCTLDGVCDPFCASDPDCLCAAVTNCHSNADCFGGICKRTSGTCICPQ